MAESIHERIRVMNALDYAAEVATRAGHNEFPADVSHKMIREAGRIHESIARDLFDLAATDVDTAKSGAAALDAMRTATRRLARLNLAGKACLSTPSSASAGEAVRGIYGSISDATGDAQGEQLAAMRALMDAHAAIVNSE